MGGILSYPVCSQALERKGNQRVRCGSTEMQGYRKQMEDYQNVELSLPSHPNIGLFGVYDGHGGDCASAFLAQQLPAAINRLKNPMNDNAVISTVVDLDKEFVQVEKDNADHGSACVFALVEFDDGKGVHEVMVTNVGDSRALIIRSDGTFEPLSSDHKPSLPTEEQRIVAAGGCVSMDRVDGALALSRAFGDYQYKKNDALPYERQKVIAIGEVMRTQAKEGDILAVFCDGLVEQMQNEDVVRHIKDNLAKYPDDPARVAQYTVKASLVSGSKDNHSLMLIQFKNGEDYNRPKEFVAGPFKPYESDQDFATAYMEDAEKHGYRGEELMKLAANADMDGMPQPNESGPPGGINLSQLISLARMQGMQVTNDGSGAITLVADDDDNTTPAS